MKFIKNIFKRLINLIIFEIINSLNSQIKINPLHFYDFYNAKESYLKYKNEMREVPLFRKGDDIRTYSFKRLIANFPNQHYLVIQLGLNNGKNSKHYSYLVNKFKCSCEIIGFDSWRGLSEDWIGMTKGRDKGSQLVKKPKAPNFCIFKKGNILKELNKFLSKNNKKSLNLIHFNLDTYTPTKSCLSILKPFLKKGTILIFDDFYGYPGWIMHENKAFEEFIFESEIKYKFICFGKFECALEII